MPALVVHHAYVLVLVAWIAGPRPDDAPLRPGRGTKRPAAVLTAVSPAAEPGYVLRECGHGQ